MANEPGELVPATGRQQSNGATYHHWLIIQGQRSMRGLRMNTLAGSILNQRGLHHRIHDCWLIQNHYTNAVLNGVPRSRVR